MNVDQRLCRLAHALHLAQVHEVMAGDDPGLVLDRLASALGVHAGVLPLLGRDTREEAHVGGAGAFELREHVLDGLVAAPEVGHPDVLVVGADRRAVLGDGEPVAPGADELRVGEVLRHLQHRPFPRPLGTPQPDVIDGRRKLAQARGGGTQNVERIAIAEGVEQRFCVRGRRVDGVAGRVGEGHERVSFLRSEDSARSGWGGYPKNLFLTAIPTLLPTLSPTVTAYLGPQRRRTWSSIRTDSTHFWDARSSTSGRRCMRGWSSSA